MACEIPQLQAYSVVVAEPHDGSLSQEVAAVTREFVGLVGKLKNYEDALKNLGLGHSPISLCQNYTVLVVDEDLPFGSNGIDQVSVWEPQKAVKANAHMGLELVMRVGEANGFDGVYFVSPNPSSIMKQLLDNGVLGSMSERIYNRGKEFVLGVKPIDKLYEDVAIAIAGVS